MTTGKSWRC